MDRRCESQGGCIDRVADQAGVEQGGVHLRRLDAVGQLSPQQQAAPPHRLDPGDREQLIGEPPAGALRHSEDYLFLPGDTAEDGGHWRPSTVVRWTVFQNALQNARGVRLMFVDTCHAGGAYNPRLIKDAHDAEIIVFSATDASTKALELVTLGHGVFTFALTQGLTGGAANHDGAVELFALQSYVARQVENLTHGTQAPAIHLSGVKNFVIARKG